MTNQVTEELVYWGLADPPDGPGSPVETDDRRETDERETDDRREAVEQTHR